MAATPMTTWKETNGLWWFCMRYCCNKSSTHCKWHHLEGKKKSIFYIELKHVRVKMMEKEKALPQIARRQEYQQSNIMPPIRCLSEESCTVNEYLNLPIEILLDWGLHPWTHSPPGLYHWHLWKAKSEQLRNLTLALGVSHFPVVNQQMKWKNTSI